jgi:general secretion pathway protein J
MAGGFKNEIPYPKDLENSEQNNLRGNGQRLTMKEKKSLIFGRQSLSISLDEEGFTLLELLISIVMLGIIVVILVGALRLGFRSVDSGEKKMESLERMRVSLSVIDSQIQSQFPLTYQEEEAEKYYFTGERDSLQFSTNYSIWGGKKGNVVVSYSVSEEEGKSILYASEHIVGIEESKETKLLDAFDDIYFEYFYKGPTDEIGNWVEEWTDTTQIPAKIKIHLIKGGNDLPLIVPVRIGRSLLQTDLASTAKEPNE